jgi:hypothetical protein
MFSSWSSDEFLFVEQYAIGQAQPIEVALCPTSPRSEIADRDRQRLEGLRSLGAEKVQMRVLAGSPGLVTHANSDLDCG